MGDVQNVTQYKYYFEYQPCAARRRRGQAAHGAGGAHRDDDEEADEGAAAGQPTVAKAEAAQGQTAINQKWQQRSSTYYFKCNILNITRLR